MWIRLIKRKNEGAARVFAATNLKGKAESFVKKEGNAFEELRSATGLDDDAEGIYEEARFGENIGIEPIVMEL